MLIYSLLTLLTCGLGCFVRGRRQIPGSIPFVPRLPENRDSFRNGVCLFGIFILLFSLSALRVGLGNDYYKYVEFINRITFDSYVPTESGFNGLVKLSNLLFGEENFVLFFALMAALTIPLFLAAFYRESAHFGLSLFFFMTLGFYFQTLNTIRYYLALGILLFGLSFLLREERKGIFPFIALSLLASLFHKSALIAIPFYLAVLLLLRSGKRLPAMLTGIGALCALIGLSSLFFREAYLRFVVLLYPSYENVGPLEGGTSYAGILRCLLTLGLLLYALHRRGRLRELVQSPDIRTGFYLIGTLLTLYLYLFFSFLPQISRLAYYGAVLQLLAIPEAFSMLRGEEEGVPGRKRKAGLLSLFPGRRVSAGGLLLGLILFGTVYFGLFLREARSEELGLLPYRSILFEEPRSYEGTWE